MFKYLFLSVVVILPSLSMAQKKKAEASSETSSYEAPWGMAGCDLWAMVIKEKSQGAQLGVYALRNLVLNSQTSAISSGTSGCVEKKQGYAAQEQRVFINVNLATLQREAAQGQGDHLDALAEVFGCEDKASFSGLSKDNYDGIYNSQDAGAVIENYRKVIQSSPTVKKCSRLS